MKSALSLPLVAAIIGCAENGPVVKDPPTFNALVAHPLRVTDGTEVGGFAQVGWTGQLSNGTIVVADRRLAELWFFPQSGTPFRVAGRGPGPEEFDYVLDAGMMAGDSTAVTSSSRVSVFSPRGDYVRAFPVPVPGSAHYIVGDIRGGGVVLQMRPPGYTLAEQGLRLDSTLLVAVNPVNGSAVWTLYLPHRRSYVRSAPGERTFWTFPPFFPQGSAAVVDSLLVWVFGDRPYLYLIDAAGEVRDSVRIGLPRKRLDRAHVTAALEQRVANAAEDRRLRLNWESMFEAVEFPSHYPYFDQLIRGAHGTVWLRLPPTPGATAAEWWNFDLAGLPKRLVRLPLSHRPVEFADSTVLTVHTDSLDISRVMLVRLVPPSG